MIEDGVKLDNQIQIGHNCRIGAHTAIAGCVGIAGSSRIGQHCMIGGAARIVGHLRPVRRRRGVGVHGRHAQSIRKPGTYTGVYPFEENAAWARNAAWLRHLAELADRVSGLEKPVRKQGEGKPWLMSRCQDVLSLPAAPLPGDHDRPRARLRARQAASSR